MTDSSAETTESSPLMAYVVTMLSALMSPCLAGQHLARLAAREAIAAQTTSAGGQLLTIAQILGFAMTALDTLRLSMPEDLSLSMKLRLRGSANALNRFARDNTSIQNRARPLSTPGPGMPVPPGPARAAMDRGRGSSHAENAPKPEAQHLTGGDWSKAMQSAAMRLRKDAAIVSPAQRETDTLWIEALTKVAGELAQAKKPANNPGMLKAGLLRSTIMSSDHGMPAYLFNGGKPNHG